MKKKMVNCSECGRLATYAEAKRMGWYLHKDSKHTVLCSICGYHGKVGKGKKQ
jgi:endogenous inhibitor of DNA gyrase (YacG/DUF329 family)